jgi:hypothetical protein
LKHWHKSEVKLSIARDKWLENSPKCWTLIANFKEKQDRDALCKYAISGELLESHVGNTTMFSLPDGYIGNISLNESCFESIYFDKLMEIRIKNDSLNIVECAIEYLRSSINNLQSHIINRTIIIDINFEMVDITKLETLSKIASFNPSTISWSNICDYTNYDDFHEMCRKCSSPKNLNSTLHYFYSMNWPTRTYGSSHIDYMYLNESIKEEVFQDAIKCSNLMVSKFYDLFGYKKLLLTEPIDDLRNLIDFSFYMQNYKSWVKHFISKSNIDQPKEQAFFDKSIYNVFSHTSSTIYFVICYDPDVKINYTTFK